MKKILMTLAAVLCCTMTTTVLTACGGDDEPTYSTSYHYRVHFDSYLWQCDVTEYHQVQDAFDQAVGDVPGTVNKVYSTPQDEEMKAKCEAVKKRFSNLTSDYMKFELQRIMSNSAKPAEEAKIVIAVYELGKSVQ